MLATVIPKVAEVFSIDDISRLEFSGCPDGKKHFSIAKLIYLSLIVLG